MLLYKNTLLNITLFFMVVVLGIVLYSNITAEFPVITKIIPESVAVESPPEAPRLQVIPPLSTYGVVAEQSLFAPDRKEFVPVPEQEEAAEQKVKEGVEVSGKEVELYATMLSRNKSALIFNPDKNLEKHNQWVSIGDRVARLKVVDITANSILLKGGRETYEIKLRGKKKTRKTASRVPNKKADRKPVKPNIVSAKPAGSGHDGKKAGSTSTSKKKETIIIHTPFGDIIREK